MKHLVTIYVLQSDIESAKRIAMKMFPDAPDLHEARYVIAAAANMGMKTLRVIWHDAEDQANAYADAKIRSDKLHANDGRPEHDTTIDGMPLRQGQ